MKKYKRYLIWGSALLVVFTLALSQYPAYYTIIVRTFLDVRGKAVVADSLRVGTSTPVIIKADGTISSKAITSTGLSVNDSSTFSGSVRIGGLVAYVQRLAIKNGLLLNALDIFNSRGTSIAKVDSSGLITSVGLTTTGAITATSQTLAVGVITSSGASQFDSLKVVGNSRLGGLAAYDQRFSVKNDAINSNLVNFYNSRNSSVFKVDSSGLITSVGLTTTGAITATSQTIASGAITASGRSAIDSVVFVGQTYVGAIVNYISKFSIKNNATHPWIASLFNSRGTRLWGVDSSGYAFSTTTVIDSFATTGAVDSVSLSSADGFTVNTKVFVQQWNPSWSADVDTSIYAGYVYINGANNPTLVITRVKSYVGGGVTAVKSGAQYFAKLEK